MHPIWSATFSGKDVSWVATGVPDNITIPRVDGEMLGYSIELFPFDLRYGSGIVTVAGTILLEDPTRPLLDLQGTAKGIGYDGVPWPGNYLVRVSLTGKWPAPDLAGQLRLYQEIRSCQARPGKCPALALDIPLSLELEIDEVLLLLVLGCWMWWRVEHCR